MLSSFCINSLSFKNIRSTHNLFTAPFSFTFFGSCGVPPFPYKFEAWFEYFFSQRFNTKNTLLFLNLGNVSTQKKGKQYEWMEMNGNDMKSMKGNGMKGNERNGHKRKGTERKWKEGNKMKLTCIIGSKKWLQKVGPLYLLPPLQITLKRKQLTLLTTSLLITTVHYVTHFPH